MDGKYAIELVGLTIPNDRQRDHYREYAVREVTLRVPKNSKTMIYGLRCAGKTAIKQALFTASVYPGMVHVNHHLHELGLKDSRHWTTKDYERQYLHLVQPGDLVVTDDPYDQAFEFLLNLPSGVLVFSGVDGYGFINRFDLIVYLQSGQIAFSGSSQDFWRWVKENKPEELMNYLPKHLIESGGDPG
jgi:hypothetical protein